MEKPTLLLTIKKGPRKGETLECKPGALNRIGRVVRGNTLCIKDPGISQSHLSFQFIPETSRWFVSDLDTSNGTLLNGAYIPPSVPTPLSHGDLIKIGEMTSFSVGIFRPEPPPPPEPAAQEEEESGLRPKRPGLRPKRTGAPLAALGESGLRPKRQRGAPPAAWGENGEEPARAGGRGRRKPAAPAGVSNQEEALDSAAEEKVEVVVEKVGRGRRPSQKKAAGSARVSKRDGFLDLVVEERVEEAEVNAGNPKKATVSANVSVKEEILESVAEETFDSVVNDVRRGRGRGRGRGRATRSRLLTADETSDSVPVSATEAPTAAEKVDSRVESNADDGDKLVRGGERELGAEKVSDDMENMTLGEWFDRLEIYLPQAINDVADEMIASLMKTAQCLNEYIANGSIDKVV